MLEKRIVWVLGVGQGLQPHRVLHAGQLPPAHAVLHHIHRLKSHPALLEPALRLFGIKAFGPAKNLYVHYDILRKRGPPRPLPPPGRAACMVPVSFLRLLNYVYLSITYSLPGHKSKPLRNRFISPAAGHTRRCYKYRAVPAPPRRSPAGRVETHRESCHYGGRRGDPPAPPVPGHAEAHGPLLGRPVMEHIIGLLKRHGIDEIAVTLCYMPEAVQSYFGDGQKWGVRLHYFIEEAPLGTAGSVRACAPLPGGRGLPGHQRGQRLRPGSHCRHGVPSGQAGPGHPGPLPSSRAPGYGLVLTDEEQRVVRFVEKPSWGQVVTDLVNTGIYLLSPGAGADPPDRPWDFGKDVFPALLESGGGLYGVPGGGYWCDMGDCGAYLDCAADALSGKVKLDMGLPQQSPGVWSAQPIPEGVTVIPPCWLGRGRRWSRAP